VTGSDWQVPEGAPEADLWALVEWRTDRTPDSVFLTAADGRAMTFRQYRDSCLRTAAALSRQGVDATSTVAWQLPTDLDAAVLIGALARSGSTQVPLLPSYRERELRAVVDAARPQLLVVPPAWRGFDHAALATALADATPGLHALTLHDGLPQADPAGLGDRPAAAGDVTSAARWVFFTSGTTADPKGVRHSDATLIAAAIGTSEASAQVTDDVYLLLTPIAHVGGVIALCSGLLTGCRSVLVPAYEPASVVDVIARESVTIAAAPLTVQRAFVDAQRRAPDRRAFASVRAFPIGGAPTPPDLHRQLREEIGGTGLLSGYGMTECPIATKNRVGDPDEKLGHTEGRPTRGVRVRIVATDASGDGEGEIRVRGPQLFLGYMDSTLDSTALDEDGFFRTGDLGRLDSEGFLVVTGRLKDVIIRKGENISAAEVEHLLRHHPLIADVAVIGVPDPELGEKACAVVELVDPQASLTLPDVTEFLVAEGLMKQKLPELLDIVAALPRNAFGKADKQTLRSARRTGPVG
jgi:cyclohexanecarboxylate-CoA ligase